VRCLLDYGADVNIRVSVFSFGVYATPASYYHNVFRSNIVCLSYVLHFRKLQSYNVTV